MAMEYEVNNEKKLVVKLGAKSECYDLEKTMSENALIVKEEKRDILHQMDLPAVISNLDNTVDLLNISYHAVYGFPEYKQVFNLQYTVMNLNDQGILVVTGFKDKSAQIIVELQGVYRYLLKGIETMAIDKLERFADMAADMSGQAEEMAEGYQNAADNTAAVLKSVMDQNAAQIEKNAELEKMQKELEASQESVEAIQKSIEESLMNLEKEYSRLVKVDDDERSHKRTMDIMGAVFGLLGAATSAVSDVVGSKSEGGSGKNDQSQEEYDKAKKKKEELEEQIKETEEEIKTLEEKVKELAAKKDSAEGDEKEELTKEFNDARAEVSAARQKKEDLEIKKKAAGDTLSRLGSALSEQGAKIQQQAASDGEASQTRAAQMSEIYAEIMRLEKQKTEQVGLLAKYAKQMEATVIDRQSTEAAIQSLILAISCLKKSVVALKDIALFWSSLERSCKMLADNSLKEDIIALQSVDKATRIEEYQSKEIMYPIASYMAKWVAVSSVSQEYLAAAEKTRFHLNDTVANADSRDMSQKEHWELASKLAGEIGDRLTRQITQK